MLSVLSIVIIAGTLFSVEIVVEAEKKIVEKEKTIIKKKQLECEKQNNCHLVCALWDPDCPEGAQQLWFDYAEFNTALVYVRVELDRKTENMTLVNMLYLHGSAG